MNARTARFLSIAMFALFVGFASDVAGATSEYWSPVSTDAIAITGPIEVTERSLTFEHQQRLSIRFVGIRPIDQLISADAHSSAGAVVRIPLYRVSTQSHLRLRNGNHLCGSEKNADASFIGIQRGGDGTIALYTFGGALKADVSGNLNAFCGVSFYSGRAKE